MVKVKVKKVNVVREKKIWIVFLIKGVMGFDLFDLGFKFFKLIESFDKIVFLLCWFFLELFGREFFEVLLVVVNSMLIVINENFIIVGDKNGLVFLIVFIVWFIDWLDLVKFINCEELFWI